MRTKKLNHKGKPKDLQKESLSNILIQGFNETFERAYKKHLSEAIKKGLARRKRMKAGNL